MTPPVKKFLFIVEDLYGGGAEKVLLNTASLLKDAGADVTLFTLREKIDHTLPDNIHPINLGIVTKLTKAISNVAVEKIQASLILKKVKEISPDVIISCSCDKITRHLPDTLNIYYWIHGNVTGFAKDNAKGYEKFKRFYNGKKLICVSRGIADDILHNVKATPKSCQVIYNPFDIEKIQALANEPFSKPFGKYFIHVGTFEERKRHDRLLQAYQLSGVDTPLILMGKGERRPHIEAMIEEMNLASKVKIIDFQKNPYPYIKAAQALILTSDAEGLPTVLIEALICHTPVISVDCPSGPAEILTKPLDKFLIPIEDISGLAMAITSVDRRRTSIDSNCYQPFSSESVTEQFISL
ncbi:glycosyltransferase [Aeromonas veronii]|uniref:glycosyltransferase n=1 Tax=Aeromonas TaxID=642 RepID=UPI001C22C1E1|nr:MULTISPECIES: glycosyltransferase [Aeromonas]MBW3782869.1 glycosyltransferase [Aeromonas veronii]QXB01039.1 glycosyltransferase [Aeromonas sp. FDAARGOS 1416]